MPKNEEDKWTQEGRQKIVDYIENISENKEDKTADKEDKPSSFQSTQDGAPKDDIQKPTDTQDVEPKQPQQEEAQSQQQSQSQQQAQPKDFHINGISSAYGLEPKAYKEKKKDSKHSIWGDMNPPERKKGGKYGEDKGNDIMEIFWNKYICGFYEFVLDKPIDFILDFTDWVFFKRSDKKDKKRDEKVNMYKMAEKNYNEKCAYIDKRKELALKAHKELVNNLDLLEEGKEPVWTFSKKEPELGLAKEKLRQLDEYRKKAKENTPEGYKENMAILERAIKNKDTKATNEGIDKLIDLLSGDTKFDRAKAELTKIQRDIAKLPQIEQILQEQDSKDRLSKLQGCGCNFIQFEEGSYKDINGIKREFFNKIGDKITDLKKDISEESVILERFYAFPQAVENGAKKAKMLASIGYRLVAEDMTVNKNVTMLPPKAIEIFEQLQESIKNKKVDTSTTKIAELLSFVDSEHPTAKEIKGILNAVRHKVTDPNCDFDKLGEDLLPIKEEIIKPKSLEHIEFAMINKEEAIEEKLNENIDKIYEKCESNEEISSTIKRYFEHISAATKEADVYTSNIANAGFKSKFKSYHKTAAQKTQKALESVSNFMLKDKSIGNIEKAPKGSIDLFSRKNKTQEFIVRYNAERRA